MSGPRFTCSEPDVRHCDECLVDDCLEGEVVERIQHLLARLDVRSDERHRALNTRLDVGLRSIEERVSGVDGRVRHLERELAEQGARAAVHYAKLDEVAQRVGELEDARERDVGRGEGQADMGRRAVSALAFALGNWRGLAAAAGLLGAAGLWTAAQPRPPAAVERPPAIVLRAPHDD